MIDAAGHSAAHGTVAATGRGRWTAAYPAVYEIPFTTVTRPGQYHLAVHGVAIARSSTLPIEDAATMSAKLITDGITFEQPALDMTAAAIAAAAADLLVTRVPAGALAPGPARQCR